MKVYFEASACGEMYPDRGRLQVGKGPGEGLLAGERARLPGLGRWIWPGVWEHRVAKGLFLLTSRALSHTSPPSLPGAPRRPEACTKAPAAPRLARCGLDAGHRCAHVLVLCTALFLPFRTGEEVKAGETGGETTPFLLLLLLLPSPPLSSTPSPAPPSDLFLIPGWRG